MVDDLDVRVSQAVTQCQEQIRWFQVHSRADRYLYRSFQVAIIVLSSASPVLVLFTNVPKPVQALPAALAALTAAVAASFHWHEDAVRWAATRELLKSELRQFAVAAGRYGQGTKAEVLDSFVTRIEAIIVGELTSWRLAEQSGGASKSNGG